MVPRVVIGSDELLVIRSQKAGRRDKGLINVQVVLWVIININRWIDLGSALIPTKTCGAEIF